MQDPVQYEAPSIPPVVVCPTLCNMCLLKVLYYLVTRSFVGWVSEWTRGWGSVYVDPSCFTLWTRYRIATTVFAQSLSNFTCTLFMMRGGTLLILVHGVKGHGQLWHSIYKTLWARYRLQLLPNHFQTSHASCGWWEEEPYWFSVTGSKVNTGSQGQLWHSV